MQLIKYNAVNVQAVLGIDLRRKHLISEDTPAVSAKPVFSRAWRAPGTASPYRKRRQRRSTPAAGRQRSHTPRHVPHGHRRSTAGPQRQQIPISLSFLESPHRHW